MTKLIVHVGMPRTGTTAIQNTLALNKEIFVEKGALYPEAGRFPGQSAHHALFYSAMKKFHHSSWLPYPHITFEDHVLALRSEISNLNPDWAILSSELIWEECDEEFLSRIRAAFSSYDIKLL